MSLSQNIYPFASWKQFDFQWGSGYTPSFTSGWGTQDAKLENQYDTYYSQTASELTGTEHKKESRVL